MASVGIVYYTDNQLDPRIMQLCQDQLTLVNEELQVPIISVSLHPIEFGHNIVMEGERGYLTMFKQILMGLKTLDTDIVFFCEHDVLYHPTHFDKTLISKDKFYYNQNWWKVGKDDLAVHWDADQVSGMSCYRELAIDWYTKRIESFDKENFDRKFEPMSGEGSVAWKSEYPNIDIRHKRNLTYSKWSLDDFRKKDTAVNFELTTIDKIPGWNDLTF